MAGRQWRHEVDPAWMKARKKYLTASEIKSLLPEYKRYLKAKKEPGFMPGFCALWAEKTGDGELDISSFNAAARGHIMERYAIEDWNSQMIVNGEDEHYHWDDVIIGNGRVGFSPDAMNVNMPGCFAGPELIVENVKGKLTSPNGKLSFTAPTSILEIKSYNPGSHMKKFLEDKLKHDECYQIATAFHVLPTLQEARLVFYCPSCTELSMFEHIYSRDDLKDYLEIVDNIAELWDKTCTFCRTRIMEDDVYLKAYFKESEIYDDWLRHEADPDWASLILKDGGND